MQRNNHWLRRAVTGVIAGTTALGGLAGLAATAAHATSSFTATTVYGADRYASAGVSNEKAFPSGVSEVVLADGLPGHQGDALAASGYAGVNGYGVLLTDNTNTVPANTMTDLSTLKVKTIQPVGGTAAISAAQLAQLSAAGYTVKPSLAGTTSLGTMQAINDTIAPSSVGTSGSPAVPTAFLASVDENHLVDALSAGGAAYGLHFPVLTTETTSSTLSPQAQQVITALGIKKLIVLGGTASIPASQYTPNPTGVTSEDTTAQGIDRSTTSSDLATDLSKNYGFDSPLTSMLLAAGATFVGNTTALQNDGADALSSAPLGGLTKAVTIVTNGPTDIGQAGNFATANASTLDPLDVMTGTGNLPQTQVNTVVTDGGGSASSTANAYSMSGGSLSAAASTASAPSQGVETYTASGLPTASGTLANIALFPCFGTAQSGNGPTNGAPATSSGGATTFTAPGGTTPVAGNAVGQGTSSNNSPAATPGFSTGSVPGFTASAYLASVSGVPTTNNGANNGPTQVYGLGVSNGTLSFVVNSFQLDCVIPVVYTAPASAGGTPALLVNANGTPATGYAVGAGGPTAWSAPPAPAAATGYEVGVVLAPPLSGTGTFDGIVLPGSNNGTPGQIFSFQYTNPGSTYAYTDSTPMSQTNWGADLSAGNGGQVVPNTSTAAPVAGDKIEIGEGTGLTARTGYASGTPAAFAYDDVSLSVLSAKAFFRGDAPNTPTSPAATFNGCAFTVATVCTPGNVVTFTAPTNPDVSGAEAVKAGGAGFSANNASYQIWRSVDTGGTLGAPTEVDASLSVVPGTDTADIDNGDGQGLHAGTGGATSVSAPQFIDAGATAGTQYVYYVTDMAAVAPNGGGQTSPFSAATNPVTAGAGAVTPVIKDVVITPSQAGTLAQNAGAYTLTGGAPATATITYNETVNCLGAAGADFTYSNSGGTGSVAGTSCQQPTPAASKQLVVTLARVTQSGSGLTATFTQNTVGVPGNGDTFAYAVPSPETTSNSVFAGSVGSPSYEAAASVSSNGTPASSSNLLGSGTGVPVMGSAVVTIGATGTGKIVVTYNEDVNCLTGSFTDFSYSNGGTAATPTTCSGSGTTQLTLGSFAATLVAPGATDTLTYTQNAPTGVANAVGSTSPDTITAVTDFGLSPQTLSGQGAAVGPLS